MLFLQCISKPLILFLYSEINHKIIIEKQIKQCLTFYKQILGALTQSSAVHERIRWVPPGFRVEKRIEFIGDFVILKENERRVWAEAPGVPVSRCSLTSRLRQPPRRTDTLSSRKQSCSRKVRSITRMSARSRGRKRRRDAEGAPRALLYTRPRAPPPLQRNRQRGDKTNKRHQNI